MNLYDASKFFLRRLLYYNASFDELNRGLYFNCTDSEFENAINILKENEQFIDEEIIFQMHGGYMIYAALCSAKKW